MSSYKYYAALDSYSKPIEIYRGDYVGPLEFIADPKLWRAKKDGSWSDDPRETQWIYERMNQGDFDPEDDEITEAQAMTYLEQWRSGTWPGRE